MPQISTQALILCITATETEIKRMRALVSNGEAEAEDYQVLQDWTDTAQELKEVYLAESKRVLNLPLYEDLIV